MSNKLRAPAYPLVTVDPYFSLWSMNDELNGDHVRHWTSKSNVLAAYLTIDGIQKQIMGKNDSREKMKQIDVDVNAMTTTYQFMDEKIKVTLRFTTPLFLDNLELLTRPVSYMAVSYTSVDGNPHRVSLSVRASEELVMNEKGQDEIVIEHEIIDQIPIVKMGRKNQELLKRAGDDIRIEWGYFYMGARNATLGKSRCPQCNLIVTTLDVDMVENKTTLVLLAYDDIASIQYFGDNLKSVWNSRGESIIEKIGEAEKEYESLIQKCDAFSKKLYEDAEKAGGKKYADLLALAYRQVIAAHKCVKDNEGNILFVSKECFSNGCAATVDVSYPSVPLFLLYNPELVKGMMRPIYKYAASKDWTFDFAPHDAGRYPLVNGQFYNTGILEKQMPVEECGNMLIMETAVAIAEKDASFAKLHWDFLTQWVQYLLEYGNDPANQLCTDDFAGHLAHNCNLSIKAIMGITGFSILNEMLGKKEEATYYKNKAKEMAVSFMERALNEDGSYRLAFDQPNTFSMKYNAVWDKLWGTNIFPDGAFKKELESNFTHMGPYGMPLDNRADYTKSDWLLWTATLLENQEQFEKFVEPMWNFFNETIHRTPMTDWYSTVKCHQVGFQNRTVQGGLFMKLLCESQKMKTK